jgi:hypothetical protein
MRMPSRKTLLLLLLAAVALASIAGAALFVSSRMPSHTVYWSADGKYRCTVTRYPDGRVVEQREEIPHDQGK